MTTAGPQPGPGPVDRAVLATLSSDDWAGLLVATRTELRARTDLTPQLQRLRDTPTSRLVGGEGRDAVITALLSDEGLWASILARLPEDLGARLCADAGPSTAPDPPGGDASEQLRSELERTRARARSLREERDTWQRRAEGADARAARAEAALQAADGARKELEQELTALRDQLAVADDAREGALERERRRRDSERDRLARENTELRRREEQRVAADRRRRAQQQRAQVQAAAGRSEPVPRVLPGRPTRLPPDLVAGTTEWAQALLGAGRLVLVDGYNVTRQHRPGLDLEGQRAWLVQLLVTAATVHRWRPVVVFDGQEAGGSRPPAARHRVEVRFTAAGITADDELVLAVEGTDEPVVVVTDDRELSDRVRASDADVVGTTAFLSVARG